MSKIVDYVYKKYLPHQSGEFLKGGDAWVIAHAMDDKDAGRVVTMESLRKMKSKIKLPTVCKEMGVKYISTYELLEHLDFRPENYREK
jgi:ribosomal protein L7Ae-like RNA K-turn-binding protein